MRARLVRLCARVRTIARHVTSVPCSFKLCGPPKCCRCCCCCCCTMLRRKPLWAIQREAEAVTHRVYDLFSLLAVGVGGAVGSGIFVLSGAISHSNAGPATSLSWLIGGLVCSATALSYAELSCVVPSSGSSYSFAYYTLGEVFAVLGAYFLTLEYGIAAAAVARSWGDKAAFYAMEMEVLGCAKDQRCWVNSIDLVPLEMEANPSAAMLCIGTVITLLCGVQVSRLAVNVLVVLKVGLVLFVIIIGFQHFDSANVSPFIPPPPEPGTNDTMDPFVGGMHGVLLGTTIAFFGFIGFDEVTCLTMEAVNPQRDIPLAVLGTITAVTTLYILASFALVGMVPYREIDDQEGFGSAFRIVGAEWAMHVVMIGQILIVLPAVVLVSFLPQSRLLASVARDGLLPKLFAYENEHGNLTRGILASGIVMTLVSLLVPFQDLNDLISGGILLAFNLTNTSLLMLRSRGMFAPLVVGAYVAVSAALALYLVHGEKNTPTIVVLVVAAVLCVAGMRRYTALALEAPSTAFVAPGVPFVPAFAIFSNWFLFAQLSTSGFVQVGVFVTIALGVYLVARLCGMIFMEHTHQLVNDETDIWENDPSGWSGSSTGPPSAHSDGVESPPRRSSAVEIELS